MVLRTAGLDTVNAMVREGYWVDPNDLQNSLKRFVGEMAELGFAVTRASTSFSASALIQNPSLLEILAKNGIREFRMGWFPMPNDEIRSALDRARAEMECLTQMCEQCGIRAIYQVHHGKLIQSPTAAFNLVRDLPSEWVAIELDPGNNSFEGHESASYAVGILNESISWVAFKDTATWQTMPRSEEAGKGWQRTFTTVNEGVVNWQTQLEEVSRLPQPLTFVMMPFYDEHDHLLRTEKLKSEVRYLKALLDTSQRRRR